MGVKIKIEINSAAVTALLSSDVVQKDLQRRVDNMHAAIGDVGEAEYKAAVFVGKDNTGGRAMAVLRTGNMAARKDNAENNTLIRALDAGRG